MILDSGPAAEGEGLAHTTIVSTYQSVEISIVTDAFVVQH